MTAIELGRTPAGASVELPIRLANRHGLVTGATGTGKTVTMQRMAEQFSAAGVPVFAADVKGDLSGIATAFPVAFWDIFGAHGLPVRTSVQEMGAGLLSRMLGLNATQDGAMEVCFRKAEEDRAYMLTLDDLRWSLNDMLEEREDVCKRYGNITASSISAIQRNLLALESQGGDRLFGEPPFDILDMIRLDAKGRGIVNLLHADKLMEAPKLYATFLLWLLTELFRKLPECGDLAKPKLVFFFDESHLLFTDAPKPLVQKIERLVRLVRSKGVGVFFVTQSPTDVPTTVLEQLGTRVAHAMRAHTARSARTIRAAADTMRPNPAINAREAIPVLGVGQALVSVIGDDNVPTMLEQCRITKPEAQIGPVSAVERETAIANSPLRRKYAAGAADHEAAYRFNRRMMEERGINPGLDIGSQAPEPNFYLKHVPSIDIGTEKPHGIAGQLLSIAFWGGVVWLGLAVGGWI